jgi:tetratricopeptide (TPR) repeat protein
VFPPGRRVALDKENMLKKAEELTSRGRSSVKAGKYREALENYNRAASIYAEQAEHVKQTTVLQEMADVHRLTKDNGAALEIYARLMGLFDKLEDPAAKSRTHNNSGLLLARQGNYEDALTHFRKALRIFDELGKPLHVAEQWGNIGSVYRDLDQCDLAMDSYNHALPIFKKMKENEGVADQYTNIAYIHVMENRLTEALDWYQKALPLYEKAGARKKAEITCQNIAKLQGHPETDEGS